MVNKFAKHATEANKTMTSIIIIISCNGNLFLLSSVKRLSCTRAGVVAGPREGTTVVQQPAAAVKNTHYGVRVAVSSYIKYANN